MTTEVYYIYIAEGKHPDESDWNFVDYEASPEQAMNRINRYKYKTHTKGWKYRIRECGVEVKDSEVWYDEVEEEELMKKEQEELDRNSATSYGVVWKEG